MKDITITVDPRMLAHCVHCAKPMYCIYDWRVRDYCWTCTKEMKGRINPEVLIPHVELIRR